jgi:hypothetical protein
MAEEINKLVHEAGEMTITDIIIAHLQFPSHLLTNDLEKIYQHHYFWKARR